MTPKFELDWLSRWAQYAPGKIAIQDGDDGRMFSYGDCFQKAVAGASFLKERFQIGRGDRVAVLSQNELEYVILFFALQRLGAILIPINYRLTSPEVSHILKDAGAKLVVVQDEFRAVLEGISEKLPEVIALRGAGSFEEALSTGPHKTASFEAGPEDPAMIIYTSGTTGSPKGAVLSHRMLFWNSVNTTLRLDLRQDDAAVIFLPFFHTGGWNVLTTPFLHRGARLIFLKKFDADKVLTLSSSEKATLIFGVPTTMDMLARAQAFESTSLSSVRYAIVGGEPMPLELIKTWHDKGVPIRQGYGLTEFGPNVFSLNEEDAIRKIGSIGFPNFYIETRVVSDEGTDCSDNEVGELLLRGPSCMSGYWQNEKATQETIRDGWLHTGDLVRRDDEGFFYVVGRKKDMYKSGGENVYPAEVEKVLRSLRGVREVAVIGIPDEKWGEVGKAFVVLESGSTLSAEEITDFCVERLAKFKVPKKIEFLKELPKSDSGKILKKSLPSG